MYRLMNLLLNEIDDFLVKKKNMDETTIKISKELEKINIQ